MSDYVPVLTYGNLWGMAGSVVSLGMMAPNLWTCWKKYKMASHKKQMKRILLSICLFTLYLITSSVWFLFRTPALSVSQRIRVTLFIGAIIFLALSIVLLTWVVLDRLEILEVSRRRINALKGIVVLLAVAMCLILLSALFVDVASGTYALLQTVFFTVLSLFVLFSVFSKMVINYHLILKIFNTYRRVHSFTPNERKNKTFEEQTSKRRFQLITCVFTSFISDVVALTVYILSSANLVPLTMNFLSMMAFGIHFSMESIFQRYLVKFRDEMRASGQLSNTRK